MNSHLISLRLYEGPVLAMPTKYAGMIKMVLLATFYAPALPFALIYTIPGLILWYWADKVPRYYLMKLFSPFLVRFAQT